ncbi:cytochrome P450 [Paraburkholderia hospita]|uniref:cytochrome P450 n=1 Tax=Paraburkholderia hospita TaxID=169430 RepID=UPI001ABDDFFD|nr:cytochrome P450 [Paraburkholderia hospita]
MASDDLSGLGMLRALNRNAFEAFPRRCLREPVVKLTTPLKPVVIVSAADSIRHVMLDHHQDYVRLPVGQRVLRPIVGNGLLLSEGDAWKSQRRAMAPAFAPKQIQTLAVHILDAAEQACCQLENRRGNAVDLFDFFQTVSLDIAATAMFSVDISDMSPELLRLITLYVTRIGRPSIADFMLPPWIPTIATVRRALFRKRWRNLIGSAMSARRRAAVATGRPDTARTADLFDMLAQAHGNRTDDLLVDEVSTMLVAGHETTALTLFWACTLLARSPQLQAQMASEAMAADWSGMTSPVVVPDLPLARAVVQETLRLYSPAFLTARLAKRPDRICGTEVPKGSMVLIPFWLLHRDPHRWHSPDSFDPSRFADGRQPGRFDYLPFGIGPHVCIGAQLAMLEATIVLARLVRDNVIAPGDGLPALPVGVLSTRPSYFPKFSVVKRLSEAD